jgi:hypothetical protein
MNDTAGGPSRARDLHDVPCAGGGAFDDFV